MLNIKSHRLKILVVILVIILGTLSGCKKISENNSVNYSESKTEKKNDLKENEIEELEITDEQAAIIQFASELFDADQKDEYDKRKEYIIDLNKNGFSKETLKNVASGIIYTDSSIGIEKISSDGKMKKIVDVEEMKKYLKDTFGYKIKNISVIKEIWNQTSVDDDNIEIVYSEQNEKDTIYETRRFVQTAEDEYHFYTEVKMKQIKSDVDYGYRTIGTMDITAYRNNESKIGGFIFKKIVFNPENDRGLNYEIDNIINQMIRATNDCDENADERDPEGSYEINEMTNEEFQKMIDYIASSTYLLRSKKVVLKDGIYDGFQVTKSEYLDICKNTLGRENYAIPEEFVENDKIVHFYGTVGESKFETRNGRMVQSLNGKVKVTGSIAADSIENLGEKFVANGYADAKSLIGFVFDKIEVTGPLDSKNLSKLDDAQRKLIKKRLGIPENLKISINEDYIYDYSETSVHIVYVEIKEGYEKIAEAKVDAVTGEPMYDIVTYQTEDSTTAWKDAYISWIENSNGNATYVLIDVNGDEIPELVRIGANMAEGETVITYANGEVQEVQIYRMGIKYVPGGNVIDNSSGSMGEYYDQIYKIEDGKWVQIADGKYGVEDNTLPPEYDEEGNLIYDYFEWNGNIVSESEYKNYVNTTLGNDNVETVSEDGVSSTRIIELINEY